MSQLVTITPKPGSRKFQVVGAGMTQFNQISGSTNPGDVAQTGEFKGQRFPNSRQIFKPKWSLTKRRWMLAGCDKNSKKLNEIVARCKLKYQDNDPRYPGYITEADIFDDDDAFFKHKLLKIIAREGEFVLDKDVPKDMILIMSVQASHQFALKGETMGPISNRVKYLITDKNIDAAAKRNVRNQEMEATQLFAAMSDEIKTKIAMGMGLISKETEDKVLLDDMLWAAAKNTKSRASNGLSIQEYFIAMAKTTTDEINIRYLIQKARGEGHLKKTPDGWMLFGQPVGMSDGQVYDYFKNGENVKMINRLTTVIDRDTIPVPPGKEVLVNLADDVPKVEKVEEKIEEVQEVKNAFMTGEANLDDVPGTDTTQGGEDDNLNDGE